MVYPFSPFLPLQSHHLQWFIATNRNPTGAGFLPSTAWLDLLQIYGTWWILSRQNVAQHVRTEECGPCYWDNRDSKNIKKGSIQCSINWEHTQQLQKISVNNSKNLRLWALTFAQHTGVFQRYHYRCFHLETRWPLNSFKNVWFLSNHHLAVCQNLVPLVNIKIAGKWMFIPLNMVLIGIDPEPSISTTVIFTWYNYIRLYKTI